MIDVLTPIALIGTIVMLIGVLAGRSERRKD